MKPLLFLLFLLCCRLPPKLGETAKVYRIDRKKKLIKSKTSELTFTLSRRLDVPNVNTFPVTGADSTLRTTRPQRRVGKNWYEGVLYNYVGWHERVNMLMPANITFQNCILHSQTRWGILIFYKSSVVISSLVLQSSFKGRVVKKIDDFKDL